MIKVQVFSNHKYRNAYASYVDYYDADICIGECIRSICVNLGIDPDTHNGVTNNIRLYTRVFNSSTSANISDMLHKIFVNSNDIPCSTGFLNDYNLFSPLGYQKSDYNPEHTLLEFCISQNMDINVVDLFVYCID